MRYSAIVWGAALKQFGPACLAILMLGDCSMTASAGNDASLVSGKHVTADWLTNFARDIRLRHDVQCTSSTESREVTCSSAEMKSFWTFTMLGHRAHPAVVQRTMINVGGVLGIDRTGYYAGSANEFENWNRTFDVLDRNQVAEWSKYLEGVNESPTLQ